VTMVSGLPIGTQANIAGNPSQGFASFIIPGIVILILQQGMLMGITMLAGTRRDRRRRDSLHHVDATDLGYGATVTVLGRAACYFTLYLPMAYFVMAIVPPMFELPQMGSPKDYMPFIMVMLLATAFLGQTIQIFVRERETSMVLIVFTSVIFLFLSGLTWPRYAFSPFWKAVSDLVPATWGVQGFVHINSNGASLADVKDLLWPLWALTGAYFVTAVLLRHFTRPSREETALAREEWQAEMDRDEVHADA
ncbi:MAG: ABC transporter permease, partial [Duncaniella sp.]|nr:ABC transporter permease [Duncaniella sp.]